MLRVSNNRRYDATIGSGQMRFQGRQGDYKDRRCTGCVLSRAATAQAVTVPAICPPAIPARSARAATTAFPPVLRTRPLPRPPRPALIARLPHRRCPAFPSHCPDSGISPESPRYTEFRISHQDTRTVVQGTLDIPESSTKMNQPSPDLSRRIPSNMSSPVESPRRCLEQLYSPLV